MSNQYILISIFSTFLFGVFTITTTRYWVKHALSKKELDVLKKTVKVKHSKMIFIGCASSDEYNPKYNDIKNYGIPIPLFLIQLNSYIAVCLEIALTILFIITKYLVLAISASIAIFCLHWVITMIIQFITKVVCKKRRNGGTQ